MARLVYLKTTPSAHDRPSAINGPSVARPKSLPLRFSGKLTIMRQFAASLLLGVLSACGSAPYRPLPPIASKLPSDVRTAEPEFDRRVKAAFPLGSSEEKTITELRRLGFVVSSRGTDGYRFADIKRGGMICQTIWSVRWKAEAGQLREVFGVYGFRCP